MGGFDCCCSQGLTRSSHRSETEGDNSSATSLHQKGCGSTHPNAIRLFWFCQHTPLSHTTGVCGAPSRRQPARRSSSRRGCRWPPSTPSAPSSRARRSSRATPKQPRPPSTSPQPSRPCPWRLGLPSWATPASRRRRSPPRVDTTSPRAPPSRRRTASPSRPPNRSPNRRPKPPKPLPNRGPKPLKPPPNRSPSPRLHQLQWATFVRGANPLTLARSPWVEKLPALVGEPIRTPETASDTFRYG